MIKYPFQLVVGFLFTFGMSGCSSCHKTHALPLPSHFDVTPEGENVRIDPGARQSIMDGGVATFLVTGEVGYTVSTTVGGTCPVGSWDGDTYSTGAITADCSVLFLATINQFTVTAAGDGFVTIDPNADQTVAYGSTQSFTVTAATGYTRSNEVVGSCAPGTWMGDTYTTGIITEDCAISFSTTRIALEVTVVGDAYGSITPTGTRVVNYGQTASYAFTSQGRFTPSSTVGGTCPVGNWAGDTYTTGVITATCTVDFHAVPITGLYATVLTDGPITGSFYFAYWRLHSEWDNTYTVYSHSNTVMTPVAWQRPWGILDRDGNTFVYDGDHTVYKITPDGTQTTFVSSASLLYYVFDMKFDAAGNLYLVNYYVHATTNAAPSNWAVVKVTPAGEATGFIDATDNVTGSPTSMVNPYGIAFDTHGYIYLGDSAGSSAIIRKYNPDGTGVSLYASGVDSPGSMAFDSQGALFAAKQNTPAGVSKIANNGSSRSVSPFISIATTPYDLTLDPDTGNIYMLGYTNNVPTLYDIHPNGQVDIIDEDLSSRTVFYTLNWVNSGP